MTDTVTENTPDFTPEAITLTVWNASADIYGVTWQSKDMGSPVLEYTDENDTDFAHAKRIPGKVSESTGTYKNTAEIAGLSPNEKCLYRVGDESGVFSSPAVFKALSHDPDSLDMLVVTDTQDGENLGRWFPFAWRDALGRYPETELVLNVGDIVQEGGNSMLWREMFAINSDFTRTIPMLPTAGNHDYWYGYLHGYDSVTYKHFNIDIPPQDTRHGMYYSLDVGPVHFTVLSSGDSMETDSQGLVPEQYEWAKRDIAASDKKWKIVSCHNPLYSPGKYGSRHPIYGVALALREQFNAFFCESGVDLVLCGHDHVYARTYPIKPDGYPDTAFSYLTEKVEGIDAQIALDPTGPIHFEAGYAGNQFRCIEDNISDFFAKDFAAMDNMIYGTVAYARLLIKGNDLTVVMRLCSVNTGETVKEYAFGIRKMK